MPIEEPQNVWKSRLWNQEVFFLSLTQTNVLKKLTLHLMLPTILLPLGMGHAPNHISVSSCGGKFGIFFWCCELWWLFFGGGTYANFPLIVQHMLSFLCLKNLTPAWQLPWGDELTHLSLLGFYPETWQVCKLSINLPTLAGLSTTISVDKPANLCRCTVKS